MVQWRVIFIRKLTTQLTEHHTAPEIVARRVESVRDIDIQLSSKPATREVHTPRDADENPCREEQLCR